MIYEKKMPTKQGFYSWFQEKKDPYLVAQYRYLFFEIDKYCNRTKAIGAGLFDPLSQERVLQIQRVMENDKWYRIFHKKELEEIRKAFRFILEYLQGLDAENTKALAKSAADKVKSDESLKEENHRDEPPLEKETPPAPAPAPASVPVQIKKPDVRRKQKTYFQDDKEAFFLWLGKDKKIPEQDRKRIISAISISEMYLQDNISARFALFSKDAGLVRESISVLLADSIFRTRNEERQGKYYTALQKLEEYNNERDPNYLPGAESEKRPTNYEQEALPKTADNKAHEGSLPEKPDADNCIDTVEAIPSTNDSDAKVEKEIDEEQHINETSTVDHSASDSAPTLSLSDQIETILRVECEKNPYGTTVAFIKGKIPNARLTEIKDILTTAAWAKSEMGAWKYVIPTISSSEQKDVAEDPIDESDDNNSIRQEFFAWLPNAVPSSRVLYLKRKIADIDALLQQQKFLPQPLFSTTKLWQLETAEYLMRKKLPAQERVLACEVLKSYAAFLREKKKKSTGATKNNEDVIPQAVACAVSERQSLPEDIASADDQTPPTALPQSSKISLYSDILAEKFIRGFRLGSGLDMKKFKRYYEEKAGTPIRKTDAQIESAITRCGIQYDGKVFLPSAMLPAALRDELFGFVRDSLNRGKPALYYEAIFRVFSERFLDHYIYSADMLKSYIAYYNNGEFHLDSKYLSKEAAVEVNPFDDVKEYLLAAGVPVESDQICQDLLHIPQRTIMWILGSNAEFVNNGVLVANGSSSYFFIDVVELSDEDIDNIAALIHNGIEDREFLSGNELIEAIRARYPHILESNAHISSLGMRDAIKYRLKDRFSFTGNVISKLNQAISMADVFGKYAKDHPEFTISELSTLAEEMKSGVYFDDVYVHALRIDAKRFVSKKHVHFQVEKTDAAIENACSADYFPLKAIQVFSFFPDAGYPWNTVLLESYGYSFSQKYRLLHAGFNRTSSVGALVKRSSGIESFNALLARALGDSTEELNKDAALAFFVKQGYLARRNYSNIEAVLLEAKTIRNKKG